MHFRAVGDGSWRLHHLFMPSITMADTAKSTTSDTMVSSSVNPVCSLCVIISTLPGGQHAAPQNGNDFCATIVMRQQLGLPTPARTRLKTDTVFKFCAAF